MTPMISDSIEKSILNQLEISQFVVKKEIKKYGENRKKRGWIFENFCFILDFEL